MADIRKEMVPVGGRAGFVASGRLLMADIRKEMVPVGGRARVCCPWPPADGGHS